jgi:DNA-directed RNA polymerase specialized sigma24 family protein
MSATNKSLVKLRQFFQSDGSSLDVQRNLERIFKGYYPILMRLSLARGFSPEISEEIAHEALIYAFRNIKYFDPRSSFAAWLFGIVKTLHKDDLRRSRAGKQYTLQKALGTKLLDRLQARYGRRVELDFLSRLSKQPSPPGTHLHAFASAVFSKKSFQLVFEPTIRDMRDEYCEALCEDQLQRAAWIRIRGYWSFWSAVLVQLPIAVTKLVVTAWKAIK